jgi:hypothetical protein
METLFRKLFCILILLLNSMIAYSGLPQIEGKPLEFYVSWNEFMRINNAPHRSVPVGQQVLIPVRFSEASQWHGFKIRLVAPQRDNKPDIFEQIVLDANQTSPFIVYIPLQTDNTWSDDHHRHNFSDLVLQLDDSDGEKDPYCVMLNIGFSGRVDEVIFSNNFSEEDSAKQKLSTLVCR